MGKKQSQISLYQLIHSTYLWLVICVRQVLIIWLCRNVRIANRRRSLRMNWSWTSCGPSEVSSREWSSMTLSSPDRPTVSPVFRVCPGTPCCWSSPPTTTRRDWSHLWWTDWMEKSQLEQGRYSWLPTRRESNFLYETWNLTEDKNKNAPIRMWYNFFLREF